MRLGELHDAFNMKVSVLIMYTRHLRPPRDIDAQVLVDIDLSSLGKPWEGFIIDSQRVREEYSHIPDKDFRIGRGMFFQKLLMRPTVYLTQYFHRKYGSPGAGKSGKMDSRIWITVIPLIRHMLARNFLIVPGVFYLNTFAGLLSRVYC